MLMGRGADARVRLAAGCAAARDAAERRMLTLSQAISYLFENNPDSCLAVMRQRSEFVEANHDPIESARDRDMQGQILSHYGRYPEAADQFETALAIVRASPLPEEVQELHRLRYHQHMGCDIAIPTGNFREAEVHLAEVEKCAERGDRPRVEFVLHYYRGLMAAANGDYPAAVKEYEQSFSADHLVLFQMGSAYEKMNERDQAMMYYQKAIATPALNSVAYALLWLRVREALARVGDAVS